MKVYIGIDWSERKHNICYEHANGEVLRNLEIPHTLSGFVAMDQGRRELGVEAKECVVGLETAHNLLVDYLVEQGYAQIYVLTAKTVISARGRYRQSGAKDDRWDARLIADILRTDQMRYIPWKADSPLTRQIRATVRMVEHLTQEVVRNSNRLRALLLRYYPGAVNVFSSLDAPILLAFVQAYPTPQAAASLSYTDFCSFLRQHHHTQLKKWPQCYNRLQEAYSQASTDIVAIYSPQALSLAEILTLQVQNKATWLKELTRLYEQHPDRAIYASLPAAGPFLEPALLSKFGDDRQHFPHPHILQALAGTCPVTKSSGRHRHVAFRQACDHSFRRIMSQWAKLTVDVSPWAEAYYRSVLPHCANTHDAIRRLANRWLAILWRCWYDRKPYDQAFHLKQHASRCQPK